MHKIFAAFLFACLSIAAQQPGQPVLVDMGFNPLCAGALPVDLSDLCIANAPPSNLYALILQAHSPLTTRFDYSITVTMADGTEKTVRGRVDADPGTQTVMKLVSFGGAIVAPPRIHVEEFARVGASSNP